LLIEKNYLDLLIRNGYKIQIIESDWRLRLIFQDVEDLRVQCKLNEAIYKDDKQAMESEIRALKKELVDVKLAWKNHIDEIISRKLNDFMEKYRS
jgi:hypothetical protein